MKIQQNVRGDTAENDLFIGDEGQFTVDIDRWEVRLHDGITPGGHRILNLSQLFELFVKLDSELGNVQFSPEEKGFLTRIDDKSWALRSFQEGNGIEISNKAGTAGNPSISVSADYVGGIASGLLARRMFNFFTGGTGNAFTISLDGITPAWTFGNGVFFSVVFHADVANSATLKVGALEALPIAFANGSGNFDGAILAGTRAVLVLSEGMWWVIGIQRAIETPIYPIEGLPGVKNVQNALSALRGMVGGGGSGGIASAFGAATYGVMSMVTSTITQATHPIAIGESRVMYTAMSTPADINNNATLKRELWVLYRLSSGYYRGRISYLNSDITYLGASRVPDPDYAATDVIRIPIRSQFLGAGFSFFGNPPFPVGITGIGEIISL